MYVPKSIEQQNSQKYAVMIFIHGGGFDSVSASMSVFNGTNIAGIGNVILVTINYRLGKVRKNKN